MFQAYIEFPGLSNHLFNFKESCTYKDIQKVVSKHYNVDVSRYRLKTSLGLYLNESFHFKEYFNVSIPTCISVMPSLLGGKGGFGNRLRSQGAKMSMIKTTNFEACRDLSGRRLKTIHDAERLARHILEEPERKQKEKEKLKKKIEKILEDPFERSKKKFIEDSEFLDQSRITQSRIEEGVIANIESEIMKCKNKENNSVKISKKWNVDSDSDTDEETSK
ncbi:hypothetical protein ROZALSC1DRAFT_29854 [Rozella allomycis CSF55]|uniref:SDE2-like domain-containing protein n=1 Tax=Rozella allomycis (strain CSF55) TaxID=988480 RepID=A0A4P9YJB1_ROZAC|nr:hypothetical protein ROZALSC1DRAFT_29854 [Rozella allomycis CSF55]